MTDQDENLDYEPLARLVRLPFWTLGQARQVLAAQAVSGKSIERFAARYRLSPGRLYSSRKRLEAVPPTGCSIDSNACVLSVRLSAGVEVRVFAKAPDWLVRCVLSSLVDPEGQQDR